MQCSLADISKEITDFVFVDSSAVNLLNLLATTCSVSNIILRQW